MLALPRAKGNELLGRGQEMPGCMTSRQGRGSDSRPSVGENPTEVSWVCPAPKAGAGVCPEWLARGMLPVPQGVCSSRGGRAFCCTPGQPGPASPAHHLAGQVEHVALGPVLGSSWSPGALDRCHLLTLLLVSPTTPLCHAHISTPSLSPDCGEATAMSHLPCEWHKAHAPGEGFSASPLYPAGTIVVSVLPPPCAPWGSGDLSCCGALSYQGVCAGLGLEPRSLAHASPAGQAATVRAGAVPCSRCCLAPSGWAGSSSSRLHCNVRKGAGWGEWD